MNVLLREDAWGSAATALALGIALWFLVRRWNAVRGHTLALGALNVFWGVWIAIMGTGHLSAVTAKAILGILPPTIHLWIAIPFGFGWWFPAIDSSLEQGRWSGTTPTRVGRHWF